MSKIALSGLDSARFYYVGQVNATGPWHMDAHDHASHELILVLRGAMTSRLKDATLHARAGSAMIYPANHIHEEWSHNSERLETCFVSFSWPHLPEDISCCLSDSMGRIQTLVSWLHHERESYFPDSHVFLNSILQVVLAEYLRLAKHRGNDMVERVRAYIRTHLDEPLCLDDLAAVGGMSRYHFTRTYRVQTGLTPMRDVCRIRLEAARQLLLTTRMPLKTIAPQVGFANEHHLSRMLKKRLAMSVRELRGRARNQSVSDTKQDLRSETLL